MRRKTFSIRILIGLFITLIIIGAHSTSTHAESTSSNETTESTTIENNVGYDIKAILPENQLDKSKSYFDLRMKPGQKQTITFLINNTSDEKETFEVAINQAYTNKQGFVDYAESDIEMDESLKYPIHEIVTYEKEITVEAQSSVTYPIEIDMPKESFDGQIMAGIQVLKKNTDHSKSSISNRVGYILGLNLTETDEKIKRELMLVDVKPDVSFGSTSVVATFRNPTMEAYGKLKYEVNVTNSDGENVRSVTYDSGMELAPNSTYGLAVDWEGKRLIAGDYNMTIVVTDAKSNKWTFDEDFTITTKQANEINKVTVDSVSDHGVPWWLILIIAFMIVLLVIGVVRFYKRKKK